MTDSRHLSWAEMGSRPSGSNPAGMLLPVISTGPPCRVNLAVPAHTGLVDLQLNGRTVAAPNLDDQGRLWFKNTAAGDVQEENRLKLESFRLIDDQIPTRITIYLDLDVTGNAREITLGPFFSPAAFSPLALQSQVPARLETDGRLRLQVRPGRWHLTVTIRHNGPVAELSFIQPDDGFWPAAEVWAFVARTNLRIVEIEGVTAIDPQQTNLPGEWRQYPAYRLTAGESMLFKEIKRGDPQPAPDQLNLSRNLWLRFDGSGYTIQDQVTGRKSTGWRLEMNPPLTLGRVMVDGREQFITRRDDSAKTGVELREGNLRLTADSTYQGPIGTLPAVGWDHDFQQVRANLMLPPGWRLIHATGIDNAPGTWLNRWTLLDLFVVLIFTLAVAHLYTRTLAFIALLTLVLTWHEPQAPHWIWPVLLAGFALIKHLPAGNFLKAVKAGQILALLVLLIIAIPFGISQIRVGIYPQLEKPWQSMARLTGQPGTPSAAIPAATSGLEAEGAADIESFARRDKVTATKSEMASRALSSLSGEARSNAYNSSQVAQYDPKMQLQTGPGLPIWQWNSIALSWSGPVRAGQRISLLLLGPGANLGLAVARILLLIGLAMGLLGIGYRKGSGWQLRPARQLFLFSLLALLIALPAPARAAAFPSPELLAELQSRLLEKDTCFPDCAGLERLDLDLAPTRLILDLTVSARIDTAVPLPGDARFWLPATILIDDQPASALLRTGNTLWLQVPAGRHRIKLTGRLADQATVQLPLPLPPQHLKVSAQGWAVAGIRPDGSAEKQLQLTRIRDETDLQGKPALETGVLPPFLLVERTLLLGLVWKVETRVSRLSPPGAAVVLDLPLLPGESVITEGIRHRDGKVQLNLGAGQNTLTWESYLEPGGELVLHHAETEQWTEIWRVDVSPIFHLEYEGIPVILHQQGDRWYPTWHPWPGEEVKLAISRPAGVPGRTLTIDKATLSFSPGRRASDTTLTLDLRSSQGGQHTIILPATAELQEVRIQGQLQPIRQEGRNLPLPITPGPQEIFLKWRQPAGIATLQKTPEVDLGAPSVNTHLDLTLPTSRWPLLVGGPRMGPAILFWSVLLIMILAAFGLARTGLTPLNFHQWLLLGIGMSQSNIFGALLVVAWLIVMDRRGQVKAEMNHDHFNAMQSGLALLTLLALAALVGAVSRGLLGHPDMNIVGNGSNSTLLRWYQDSSPEKLPRAWLLSIPMYYYRLAMLAWALWLSFTLIGLVKWSWRQFSQPVLWYKPEKKTTASKTGSLQGTANKSDCGEVLPDLSDELRKE